MITFNSVCKSYGEVRALENLTLELERGEIFGYIGPNGAGKTTTMKIVTGLIRDYRGDVEIDGTNLRDSGPQLQRQLGYLPQDVGFQEWRTVEQALHTFGLLSGIDRSALPAAIDRVMERTGIAEHRRHRVVHLSGGTVGRLRLAQAILHDPDVLILDEPLSGLDPASRHQVKEIIRDLARQDRLVFVSSHVLSELDGLATRIGILHEGRIRETGSPEELRDRYRVGTAVEIGVRPGYRLDPRALTGSPVASVNQANATGAGTAGNGETPGLVVLQINPAADLDDAMAHIMRRLLEHAVPVRSIRHARPSLEDVYLRLTEGGNE